MNLLTAVLGWLTDPAHWSGSGGIPVRLAEHLYFSGLALLVALVIALPDRACWSGTPAAAAS